MVLTRLVILLHLNWGDCPLLFLTQIPIKLSGRNSFNNKTTGWENVYAIYCVLKRETPIQIAKFQRAIFGNTKNTWRQEEPRCQHRLWQESTPAISFDLIKITKITKITNITKMTKITNLTKITKVTNALIATRTCPYPSNCWAPTM